MQFKRTPEGALVAHELNGRFTGGTATHCYLGFDEIAEVIGRFLPGAAFPSIPASGSDVSQKYLSSYPVPPEGVVALRTFGRWRRD